MAGLRRGPPHTTVRVQSIVDLIGGLLDMFPEGFLQDLIGMLLQNLFNCEVPSDGSDVKDVVERNYVGNGRYRRAFFARVARQARVQARRRGQSITRPQSKIVAKATLDDMRGASASDISEAVFEMRSSVTPVGVLNTPTELVTDQLPQLRDDDDD